ncbi:hypothetical protein KDA_21870 [Dictyobacter alpinus]|uniref:DUF4367 domain-containing protein n=1 Tax=Dictyobacter alpinus TaxID=2014873 RepID=A0A402B5S8_9CHLR|nr:hypothetical protein [Dictyobacter alpinus]GCE26703.1 hypothetical protein KDA_21870 [Dictyobacter alpinus]
MYPSRWRSSTLSVYILLLSLLLVAGCGSSGGNDKQASVTPTAPPLPSPTAISGPGQQTLDTMAQKLNNAKTLHGIFKLTSSSQAFNGNVETELWKTAPDKSRSEVKQSTFSQVSTGSVSVSDGQQIWQYDPAKKIVYTGKVSHDANTPDQQNQGIAGSGGGQNQSLLNIIQSIFDNSIGTLRSSSVTVDGHNTSDVHVVPRSNGDSGTASNFNYKGEIYIDNQTQLPVKVDLDISSLGKITVTIPKLDVNPAIDNKLYTFTPPAGTKTRPLEEASGNQNTGKLTLAQAQKQAGYHLLSIPGQEGEYTLQGVAALGTPGLQTYTLNYMKGNTAFTIAEGKPLADLPARGNQTSLRGTNGTSSSNNGQTTLSWTEKGVGYRITGAITADQALEIAKLLS